MVPGPSAATVTVITDNERQEYIRAFRVMLLARTLDEKLASLYRAGKIPGGGVYLGKGQEALSVSVGINLSKGDVFAPLIRDGAGRLAFGETVLEAVRTCLGSPLGPMRARDGNVHRGRPRDGYFPMISHLGAMISVVNGALLARRFKGVSGTVGATCIGEGGTSTGAFHEALNQAAIEQLPLVLVVANNQFAYSTPTSRQFACNDLVDRAIGYGVAGHSVDATDLEACLETLKLAIGQARAGGGPQLVVGTLLRLCGHGEHDDAPYITNALKTSALGRDCLIVAEDRIQEENCATASEILAWRAQAIQEVEEAITIAQHDPQPDPYAERWQALSTKHLIDFQSEAGPNSSMS
jgi:TPP-dependent pyruvate/acetoin dehydrogenase alpha subunit